MVGCCAAGSPKLGFAPSTAISATPGGASIPQADSRWSLGADPIRFPRQLVGRRPIVPWYAPTPPRALGGCAAFSTLTGMFAIANRTRPRITCDNLLALCIVRIPSWAADAGLVRFALARFTRNRPSKEVFAFPGEVSNGTALSDLISPAAERRALFATVLASHPFGEDSAARALFANLNAWDVTVESAIRALSGREGLVVAAGYKEIGSCVASPAR